MCLISAFTGIISIRLIVNVTVFGYAAYFHSLFSITFNTHVLNLAVYFVVAFRTSVQTQWDVRLRRIGGSHVACFSRVWNICLEMYCSLLTCPHCLFVELFTSLKDKARHWGGQCPLIRLWVHVSKQNRVYFACKQIRRMELMSLWEERTYFISCLTPLGLILRRGIGSQIQLNYNESNASNLRLDNQLITDS